MCRPVWTLAIRIAFSVASAPPLVKKTLFSGPGASSAMSRAASPRLSLAKAGDTVHSVAACSWIAATSRGCWWPMFTFTSCEEKSRYRLPE